MTDKPTIFISYSHQDRVFLNELLVHLRTIQRTTSFEIWDDRKIDAGAAWFPEIEKAIARSSLAILLVSPDYLDSDFILKEELPYLLRRHSDRGLRIFPVILRPCLWKMTPLAYYQLWPREGRPLSEFEGPERDKLLVDLVEQVLAVLNRIEDISEGESKPGRHEEQIRALSDVRARSYVKSQIDDNVHFFISHSKEDGDFAENLKSRLEKEGLLGWIDIDILEAGTDWRQEIDDAVLRSHAVILVLSPASKSSEYVTYEWAFALGSGLRIVPLMLKETTIHPRLEVFQYLDFTNRRARPWNRLLSLLREIVDTNGGQ